MTYQTNITRYHSTQITRSALMPVFLLLPGCASVIPTYKIYQY